MTATTRSRRGGRRPGAGRPRRLSRELHKMLSAAGSAATRLGRSLDDLLIGADQAHVLAKALLDGRQDMPAAEVERVERVIAAGRRAVAGVRGDLARLLLDQVSRKAGPA